MRQASNQKNILSGKGDVVNYDGEEMILNEKVNSGNVLIDGIGVVMLVTSYYVTVIYLLKMVFYRSRNARS